MQVKQEISVNYSSSWCGYNGLQITDTDGSEIVIKMTADQWIDLHERCESKANSIIKERQEALKDQVDAEVDKRVSAEVERLQLEKQDSE